MRNIFGSVLLSLTLFACGGPRMSQEQLSSADFGRPIDAAEAKAIVKNYFNQTLKDPSSAEFRNFSVYKTYTDPAFLEERRFGYIICISVNAKNAFGGYTGFKNYSLLTRDGRIIDVRADASNDRPDSACRQ